jgi:hypothetical protein
MILKTIYLKHKKTDNTTKNKKGKKPQSLLLGTGKW